MPSRRALRASLVATLLTAAPAVCPYPARAEPAPEPDSPAPAAPAREPALPAAAPMPGAHEPAPAPQPPAQPQPGDPPPPPPPPAERQPGETEISVGDIRVIGQELEFDPDAQVLIITGNPRAIRGTEEIRATRMIVNTATQEFTAEGNVILSQAGQVVRTDRVTYSFAQREGQTEAARTQFGTYYIEAKHLLIRRGERGPFYVARNAEVTTCDKEHPHYALVPRKLTLYPEERWIAEDTGLEFLGVRLLTVNKVSRPIRDDDDDDESLTPSLGYDSVNGPYAYKDFWLRRSGPVWLRSSIQLNSFREPMGGVMASTRGNLQLVGSLFYRDLAPNQVSRFLQVSRLPEVGAVYTNWSEAPRAGRFLGHQVPAVEMPRIREYRNKWLFAGQATVGYFRQHSGGRPGILDGYEKSGARLAIQGQVARPVLQIGSVRLDNLRFLARQSFYDTGDAFTVIGTGIGKRLQFGNTHLSLQRFDQFTAGRTPFRFDDIELAHEWRPSLAYRTPNFNFAYSIRLDAADLGIFDQVFTVSKLFHCIEPRLTYRVRRQQFMLEIRILGLSGFHRNKATNPRSTDPSFDDPEDLFPGNP